MFMSKITLHLFCAGFLFCFYSVHAVAEDSQAIKQCAQEKVTFDGIQPLKYADITGEANAHIPLWHEHPALCASTDEAKCKGKSYLIPGNTVAVANTCGDYAHVQFIGEKTVSYGWVEGGRLKQLNEKLPFDAGEPGGIPRASWRPPPATVRVRLVKGHGVPVCEAYLQRINQIIFHEIPSCSRPDNDQIPGFTRLNRVPLTAAQVNHLYVSAYNLSHPLWPGDRVRPMHEAPLSYPDIVAYYGDADFKSAAKVKALTNKDNISVWKFNPEVDIENNGQPDNIMIWRNFFPPTWNEVPVPCGVLIDIYHGTGQLDQVPFVLNADSSKINVAKTNDIFGDATWLAKDKIAIEKKQYGPHQSIKPLGGSIEIFKYGDKYYFDTTDPVFYGVTQVKTQENNIYIYLHEAGQTQQVCQLKNADEEWEE